MGSNLKQKNKVGDNIGKKTHTFKNKHLESLFLRVFKATNSAYKNCILTL